MLANKNILLCVSGGVAVYKAVALVSKLTQAGANVKVMMTEGATRFVTPLSFQVLSKNDVFLDTFAEKDARVIAHIALADWADLVIVAPATANMISKIAHGIADDMVTTTLLATTAPVWIAPAMNLHMYNHPAVIRNMESLRQDGYRIIEPSEGYLACGYVGKGRLEEPEKIVALIVQHFQTHKHLLKGKKVIVSAGPTRERVDPVRYLSNFSTGKMGYAMAAAAHKLGAEVTLVSGPVSLMPPAGVQVVRVESAAEMLHAILERYATSDIVVKTAAVADYRPKIQHTQKMKKQAGETVIELERTTDILLTLGQKKKDQLLIGFAAETNDVLKYAKDKLQKKNADYIVANDITKAGAGFGSDTNIVTVVGHDDFMQSLGPMDKKELASAIFQIILQREGVAEAVREQ